MDTKIINFFGGPGINKSSFAYLLTGELKTRCRNAEFAGEFAKDLVWAKRDKCLQCQPYIFGKQTYRIDRLYGQVEFIVTDCPILLCAAYSDRYPESFSRSVVDTFKMYGDANINFLLKRYKPYSPIGRLQTAEEARVLDKKIKDILDYNCVPYYEATTFNEVLNTVFPTNSTQTP